jgi:predicted amidohydrolase
MNIALATFKITGDFLHNQARILEISHQAVSRGAQFLVFPEAAATGLVNNGRPEDDFKIAEPIPGPRSDQWRAFAKENGAFFSAGLLEACSGKIYDSGIVFGPDGDLLLHYRRNHPGWRFPEDDPEVYAVGSRIPVVDIRWDDIQQDGQQARIGMLICGDLWDDAILARMASKKPDILIYPFARGVPVGDDLTTYWDREFSSYRKRMASIGAITLAVNALNTEDSYPGGAWVVNGQGDILAALPALKDGFITFELKLP